MLRWGFSQGTYAASALDPSAPGLKPRGYATAARERPFGGGAAERIAWSVCIQALVGRQGARWAGAFQGDVVIEARLQRLAWCGKEVALGKPVARSQTPATP